MRTIIDTRRISRIASAALIPIIVGMAPAIAQERPDMNIDAAMKKEVLEKAITLLNENYVFPDVARKMEEAVREKMKRGGYDTITSAASFTEILTEDLQGVSRDKHLRMNYSVEPREMRQGEAPTQAEIDDYLKMSSRLNYGFEKLERLQGNIGYLDLRSFTDASIGGETAIAAMNFLANTNSLIIDLRNNGGGDPAMVALISSYLFESEPVHLNSLYFRPADKTHQWWTLPHVPGKRYGGGKDVYVLTSNGTFSAAEEFTYNLKSLKRATIIGETTGGGAHPGGIQMINKHYTIWVPTGRAINPVTGTNWEGTGVVPDVDVPADQALKTAYLMALRKELDRNTDPGLKIPLTNLVEKNEKELNEMKKSVGNSYSVPGKK